MPSKPVYKSHENGGELKWRGTGDRHDVKPCYQRTVRLCGIRRFFDLAFAARAATANGETLLIQAYSKRESSCGLARLYEYYNGVMEPWDSPGSRRLRPLGHERTTAMVFVAVFYLE
jgi:hypothetical protein